MQLLSMTLPGFPIIRDVTVQHLIESIEWLRGCSGSPVHFQPLLWDFGAIVLNYQATGWWSNFENLWFGKYQDVWPNRCSEILSPVGGCTKTMRRDMKSLAESSWSIWECSPSKILGCLIDPLHVKRHPRHLRTASTKARSLIISWMLAALIEVLHSHSGEEGREGSSQDEAELGPSASQFWMERKVKKRKLNKIKMSLLVLDQVDCCSSLWLSEVIDAVSARGAACVGCPVVKLWEPQDR